MAAGEQDIKNALVLDCGICLEPFSLIPEKTPMIFPSCGHSVCHTCSTSLSETPSHFPIRCPFDQIPNLSSLTKNFALIEQMELLSRLLPSLVVSCEGSHPSSIAATVFCCDCKKCFCDQCSSIVHSVLVGHKVVGVDQRPPSVPICEHDGLRCTLSCLEPQCSENPLICIQCVSAYGNHKDHKAERAADTDKRRMVKITERYKALQLLISSAEQSSQKTHKVLNELGVTGFNSDQKVNPDHGVLSHLEEEVEAEFDRLTRELEQRRREMREQLREIGRESLQKGNDHLSSVGKFLTLSFAASNAYSRLMGKQGEEFSLLVNDTCVLIEKALEEATQLSTVPVHSLISVKFPDPSFPRSYGDILTFQPPSTPTEVQVVRVSHSAVDISFVPPPTPLLPISAYRIEFVCEEEKSETKIAPVSVQQDPSNPSCSRITSLVTFPPDKRCQLVLVACNELGDSTPSAPIHFQSPKFQLDPSRAGEGIIIDSGNLSFTSSSHHSVLGTMSVWAGCYRWSWKAVSSGGGGSSAGHLRVGITSDPNASLNTYPGGRKDTLDWYDRRVSGSFGSLTTNRGVCTGKEGGLELNLVTKTLTFFVNDEAVGSMPIPAGEYWPIFSCHCEKDRITLI